MLLQEIFDAIHSHFFRAYMKTLVPNGNVNHGMNSDSNFTHV